MANPCPTPIPAILRRIWRHPGRRALRILCIVPALWAMASIAMQAAAPPAARLPHPLGGDARVLPDGRALLFDEQDTRYDASLEVSIEFVAQPCAVVGSTSSSSRCGRKVSARARSFGERRSASGGRSSKSCRN